MVSKRKFLKKLVKKPKIRQDVKKKIHRFDWGANGMAHRYPRLKNDRYNALALLQELTKESNYDGQVVTSQSHLIKTLKTNHDSLNFDLLSLNRLGLLQINLTPLVKNHDHFTCKLIPHKIF